MIDRSQNRKAVLTGPVVPVPTSPVYTASALWDVTTAQAKTWVMNVPPDGMIYKLAAFTHIGMPVGWTVSSISKNDEDIFSGSALYGLRFEPGSDKAGAFEYPDVIKVTVTHIYVSFTMRHYWTMSFWREQK